MGGTMKPVELPGGTGWYFPKQTGEADTCGEVPSVCDKCERVRTTALTGVLHLWWSGDPVTEEMNDALCALATELGLE